MVQFSKGSGYTFSYGCDHSKTRPFEIRTFCLHFKQSLTKWQLFVQILNGWASRFQIHLKSELSEDQPHFKQCLKKWGPFVHISNGQTSGFQIPFENQSICKPTTFDHSNPDSSLFQISNEFLKFLKTAYRRGKINFKICQVNNAKVKLAAAESRIISHRLKFLQMLGCNK